MTKFESKEVTLADIVLPVVCRCNRILWNIELLEAHVDAGHFRHLGERLRDPK